VELVGGPWTPRDAGGRGAHRDGVARHGCRQQLLRWPSARLDER
jgi:hypothetical protein